MKKQVKKVLLVVILGLFLTALINSVSAAPRVLHPTGNPLTIPRYKLVMDPLNKDYIVVGTGDNSPQIFKSEDGGDTWPYQFNVRSVAQDQHASLAIDPSGDVYIADASSSGSEIGPYFTKIASPVHSSADEIYEVGALNMGFSGRHYGNILAQDDNNIWLFDRNSDIASENVIYRRSTDGGASGVNVGTV